MTGWSQDELRQLGGAHEIGIAPAGPTGNWRKEVPIWVVRVGDDVVIRSWKGRDGAWFRHATASGRARIRAGGIVREVRLEVPEESMRPGIDAAYRAKYGHGSYLDAMVTDQAASTTLRLLPGD